MKRVTRFLLLIFFFVVLSSSFGTAEAFNQNPNLNIGNTGSLEGVLPPPGFYLSLYNVYYSADDFRDSKGDKMAGTNAIDIVAVAPQFYYISSKKIFGLTPGIQAICNAVSLDVNSDLGIDSGRSGFGDLTIGPFLGSNFNITEKSKLFWNVEFDVYFPTGRYDADASVNPGANFYTFEPWINFTWLLPHGFEISSRLHYTYNTKNDDFHHPLLGTQSYDMKPGQAFHFNYAATKTLFSENFRLGVHGYYLKQLTEDDVDGVDIPALEEDSKEQVFAIGPTAVLINKGNYFSLSAMFETDVENRPKGVKGVFRFVYKF